MTIRIALALALLVGTTALPGCVYQHEHHRGYGHGPPRHAPRHGDRYWHPDGVALRWNTNLAVYVVVGHRNRWYHHHRFLRHRKGRWQASAHLRGPWHDIGKRRVPKGLRKRHG